MPVTMEAARIRQRGAEDFSTYYESLCALQDTCPVASIRAGVKECVLNCQAYRLKKADWHPLLTALQINRALHTVVFYNKWKERAYPALWRNGYGRRLYKFHYPHVGELAMIDFMFLRLTNPKFWPRQQAKKKNEKTLSAHFNTYRSINRNRQNSSRFYHFLAMLEQYTTQIYPW